MDAGTMTTGLGLVERSSLWGRTKSTWHMHAHVSGFLGAVAVCGVVFGAVVSGQLTSGDVTVLGNSVRSLLEAIQQHQLASPTELWWSRVFSDAQLLALLWLFGVSVIGLPLVVVAVFLRSFSIGFSVGFTVIQFGWRGLAVVSGGIFIHQLFALPAIVLAGAVALRFSAGILRQNYPLGKLPIAFVRYTGAFTVCLMIAMLGAAVQAFVEPRLLQALLVI